MVVLANTIFLSAWVYNLPQTVNMNFSFCIIQSEVRITVSTTLHDVKLTVQCFG